MSGWSYPQDEKSLLELAGQGISVLLQKASLRLDVRETLKELSDGFSSLDLSGEREDLHPFMRLVSARDCLRRRVLALMKEESVVEMMGVNSRLDPLLEPTAWELTADRTPPPVPFGELYGLRDMWRDMAGRVARDLSENGRGEEAEELLSFTEEFCLGVNLSEPWSRENARYWSELDSLSRGTGKDFFSITRRKQVEGTEGILLQEDGLEPLVERLSSGLTPRKDLEWLLDRILGGNAEDLLVSDSHRAKVKEERQHFRWALDGRDGAFEALESPHGAVAVHLDNLGSELLYSLLLAVYLANCGASSVLLMSKPHVFNLSDVCPDDIETALDRLLCSRSASMRSVGRLLADLMNSGRLVIARGAALNFEASGLPLSQLTQEVDRYLKERDVRLEILFGEGFRGVALGLGRWPLTARARLLGRGPDGGRFHYPRKVIVAGKIKDCTILRGLDPRLLASIYARKNWPWDRDGLLGADFIELLDWDNLPD